MDQAILERLTAAFEKIALALEGLHAVKEKEFSKLYPERKEPKEAIVTRVKTEADRIQEEHGASDKPIDEWLSDLGEDDIIGTREREFLDRMFKEGQERHASAQADRHAEPDIAGPEAARNQV